MNLRDNTSNNPNKNDGKYAHFYKNDNSDKNNNTLINLKLTFGWTV